MLIRLTDVFDKYYFDNLRWIKLWSSKKMIKDLLKFRTVKTVWQNSASLKIEKRAGQALVSELVRSVVIFTASMVLFQLILNYIFGIPRFSNFLLYIVFISPFCVGIYEIFKFAKSGKETFFTFDRSKSVILKNGVIVDNINNITDLKIKKRSAFSFYTPYILSLRLKNQDTIFIHQSSSEAEITSLRNEVRLLIAS
jgi:hypothetical protein